MARIPYVSGSFYPSSEKELLITLKEMISSNSKKKDALGIIVPHAGYVYSGSVAGEVYASVKPKEIYVVISPSHTGEGARMAVSDETWKTPLGNVSVDENFISTLLTAEPLFEVDRVAHRHEHSLEVQLPFIQAISKDFNIVPITVQYAPVAELRKAGEAIAETIKKTKNPCMIVASSDMNHYEGRGVTHTKDKLAIEKILQLDAAGLVETVQKNHISMCGVMPAAMMLFAVAKLGATKAELIRYADSGEVNGDDSLVVGYAGVVVS
ncbi:MAG: AmmeMemoRadiSam system protein B [Candidatus Omnitrophica bacterium]|nr:AmmeMemoRadiSam system protein B [Candidatus Omnitrophota bacterium]